MRQAEDEDNVLDKPTLMDLETRQGNKGQGKLKRMKKFEISFEKTFSVETRHFNSDIFSFGDDFDIKRFLRSESFLDFVGFSEFDHQFCLSLFENKIGKYLGADIYEAMSLNNPFVDPSFMNRIFFENGSTMFFGFIEIAKMFFNPVKKFFFCIGNIENRSKTRILVSIIFSRVHPIDTNRTFTIDNSSKVSQFNWFVSNFFIRNYGHLKSPLRVDDRILSHIAA